jgi:hypothetical protein
MFHQGMLLSEGNISQPVPIPIIYFMKIILKNVEFNYMKGSRKDKFFVKAIIRSPQQFKEYYPYLHGNGCMLNLSLWSLKQDVFKKEK